MKWTLSNNRTNEHGVVVYDLHAGDKPVLVGSLYTVCHEHVLMHADAADIYSEKYESGRHSATMTVAEMREWEAKNG